MLSQLLIVRLKAAENALKDGQLDEAFRLAGAPDIREHRRGAAVLASLAKLFLERGRAHFRADRFTDAMLDLDRADMAGVLKEEIAELRGQVHTVLSEQQRNDRSRRERLGQAKRRIEGGSLAAGRRILAEASKADLAARDLQKVADARAGDAAELIDFARKLIGQGQLAEAAERIKQAKRINAYSEHVMAVETKLCEKVLGNARTAVVEGRLGRAADELACLSKLGDALPAKRELGDLLDIARQASDCLEKARFADARRHVLTLQRLIPKAKWVFAAADKLQRIDSAQTELRSGPLGEQMTMYASPQEPNRKQNRPLNKPSSLDDTVALPAINTASALSQHLLLLVDGGGSFLIVRDSQTSIGRAAAENPADVPILGDIAERHANIKRVDDDYFLYSAKDVEVGGRPTKQHLLHDGDRVVLGTKAKFTFRLPTRKSSTALLEMSDTTKIPQDVRRVVLFSKHATIGPGASAHIRCQHAGLPIILFEREGSLWVRMKSNGHVDAQAQQLVVGKPMEIGGASFVLQPWSMRLGGGVA